MEFFDIHNPVNWVVFGILLIALEILLPSTLALGFGLGAVVTAGILWILGLESVGIPTLTAIWAVSSGISWLLMRVLFKNRAANDKPHDGDINEY